MGLTAEEFIEVREAPTLQERTRLLDALKAKAKKAYTRLAFQLHPDRTGNDPEKTALFRLLTQVKADIEALEPARLPIPQPQPIVVVPHPPQPAVRVPGYFRTAASQPPVIRINPYDRARFTAVMSPDGTPRKIR